MVPREARRGASFKGAGLYYLHDKEALTTERVAWTHTENLATDDAEKGLKWMAHTARHADDLKRQSGVRRTGGKCQKPVFAFSLAWHPEEEPERAEMIEAGRGALAALGLGEHETVMVAHNDEAHAHLHCIVNLIHPETGKANSLSKSRLRLSEWAEGYERERGTVYCQNRVENNERRKRGEAVKYREPELDLKAEITRLYRGAQDGEAFRAALEEAGYKLAQGKRLVLIDRDGAMHGLTRQLDGVKAKDLRAKLAGLELPPVEDARGRQETGGREKDADAAQKQGRDGRGHGQEPSRMAESGAVERRGGAPPSPAPPGPINAVQDRHLAELGAFYERSQGARLALKQSLDLNHGEGERRLREDIAALEGLLRNAGPVRLAWLRMTGRIPRNAGADLDAMKRSLESIAWRRAEALEALEARIAREREDLKARQELERREIQPPAPEVSRGQSAARDFERAAGTDAGDETARLAGQIRERMRNRPNARGRER